MKVNSVAMNYCSVIKNPNFKAKFIENEISEDLIKSSSAKDVAEFKAACAALKDANQDSRSFFLGGVTSNYGVCCESEVADKYIELNYMTNVKNYQSFFRNWIIKTEEIVSGGYEKKNILKEITKVLQNVAKENAFVPCYKPADIIMKKATYLSKLVK